MIFHENPEHNYPSSHWVCWDCVRFERVLGSQGSETCPGCGKPMIHMYGLTTTPEGAIVVPSHHADDPASNASD